MENLTDGKTIRWLSLNDKLADANGKLFEGMTVDLPVGRSGFVGVIFSQTDPDEFTLASMANAQGGLSIDNITYIDSESENTITPTP